MARKKTTSTPVESIRHKDKRTNIPTEELRDFVAVYIQDKIHPQAIIDDFRKASADYADEHR
jgi:adenine-specific DNA-methyltransferase